MSLTRLKQISVRFFLAFVVLPLLFLSLHGVFGQSAYAGQKFYKSYYSYGYHPRGGLYPPGFHLSHRLGHRPRWHHNRGHHNCTCSSYYRGHRVRHSHHQHGHTYGDHGSIGIFFGF